MAPRPDSVRTSNAAALQRLQHRLAGVSEKSLDRSVGRALSSVRRRFEAEAKRTIRESYNVPLGELSGKFRVTSGGDSGGEYIALQASTRRVSLLSFGGRWSGRARKSGRFTPGATAQLLKGQRKTYGSAFIATIRGRRGIYARQFTAGSHSPSGRDPRNKVRRLMGPSPAQMTEGLGSANARRIGAAMNSYLRSELVRQLELAKKSS